jgi:hypothetical protein
MVNSNFPDPDPRDPNAADGSDPNQEPLEDSLGAEAEPPAPSTADLESQLDDILFQLQRNEPDLAADPAGFSQNLEELNQELEALRQFVTESTPQEVTPSLAETEPFAASTEPVVPTDSITESFVEPMAIEPDAMAEPLTEPMGMASDSMVEPLIEPTSAEAADFLSEPLPEPRGIDSGVGFGPLTESMALDADAITESSESFIPPMAAADFTSEPLPDALAAESDAIDSDAIAEPLFSSTPADAIPEPSEPVMPAAADSMPESLPEPIASPTDAIAEPLIPPVPVDLSAEPIEPEPIEPFIPPAAAAESIPEPLLEPMAADSDAIAEPLLEPMAADSIPEPAEPVLPVMAADAIPEPSEPVTPSIPPTDAIPEPWETVQPIPEPMPEPIAVESSLPPEPVPETPAPAEEQTPEPILVGAGAGGGPPTYRRILHDRQSISAFLLILACMGGILAWGLSQSGIQLAMEDENRSILGGSAPSTRTVPPNRGQLGAGGINGPGAIAPPAGITPPPLAQALESPAVSQSQERIGRFGGAMTPGVLPIEGATPSTPKATAQTPQPSKVDLSDVPRDHWAYPYLEDLHRQGIIPDFPDGKVQPDKPVTRAELAALIDQAFGGNQLASIQFKDLPADYWARDAIARVVKLGFMRGYSADIFRPDQLVPRYQVLVSLASGLDLALPQDPKALLAQYPDADQLPPWSVPKLAATSKADLISRPEAPPSLDPIRPATRAEVAVMLHKALVKSGKIAPLPSTR